MIGRACKIPVGMKMPSWPRATAFTVTPSTWPVLASRLPREPRSPTADS
jgi:hypothetical protein